MTELAHRHVTQSIPREAETPRPPKRRLSKQDGPARKRAATACALCRRRKAKCDNRRPQCSFCIRHRVACVYEDDAGVDTPSYDVATLEILAGLEEVKSLLRQHPAPEQTPPASTQIQSNMCTAARPVNAWSTQPMGLPAIACECVLQWPVFADILTESQKQITSFLFDAPHAQISGDKSAITDQLQHEIDSNDFIGLCEKFLQFVHPRNPILDPAELLESAKEVSLHGLSWDGRSCLILIVCALACITTPWSQAADMQQASHRADTSNKALAETYFHAARKRIGLLRDSIVDLQSLFFASIYEKHAMRTLEAFQYLQQLSSRLQIRRFQHHASPPQPLEVRQEARVHFSCLKALGELQPEIGLSAAFAASYTWSEELPQPPSNPFDSASGCGELSLLNSPPFSVQEEQGWLFYLSEISLRRRIQETLALVYSNGEASWLQDISEMEKQYTECKSQIELWYSHLPDSLRFDQHSSPPNEFAFYLQGRFHEWRTLLLRPFFYYTLHHDAKHGGYTNVLYLAESYLGQCSAFVQHMACHGRHGSTWFVCRHAFAAGMSVLASVIGDDRIKAPEHWADTVRLALKVLQTWAPEAADVASMANNLDKVYWEVCRQKMINPFESKG